MNVKDVHFIQSAGVIGCLIIVFACKNISGVDCGFCP